MFSVYVSVLALLAGCGEISQGTFVGNPTGNMSVSVADTPGLQAQQGVVAVGRVLLQPCEGGAPTEAEGGSIALQAGRPSGRLSIPLGEWCGLTLQDTDLLVYYAGDTEVRLELRDFDVSFTGTIRLAEGDVAAVVLGRQGWLTPAVEQGAGQAVDTAQDPELAAILQGSVASDSAVYNGGSVVAVPDSDPPAPDTAGDTGLVDTDPPPPPPPPPDPTIAPDGTPTQGVQCTNGATVRLAYRISATNMSLGASDNTGAGWCVGDVTFAEDLSPTTAGTLDDAGELMQVETNGFATQCTAVHCNDVIFGDGTLEPEVCSLYALCENGEARSVGWTW